MTQFNKEILRFSLNGLGKKSPAWVLVPLMFWCLTSSAFAQQADSVALKDAKFELAKRYEHAEGVERDYHKAADLYCGSAKSGNVDALYAMGWMYANGRGVVRDEHTAGLLFSLAAEKGHVQAEELLKYFVGKRSGGKPACLLQDSMDGDNLVAIFPNSPISKLVAKLAPLYQIDPKLAMAVISVESGFNVRAVSPKNAQGLMQLMPDTARRFRVKDTFNAEQNIKGGLAYLQWLMSHFKGDVSLVAAAYNSGEGTVKKYNGIPPYPETRNYVHKINKIYNKSVHPYRNADTPNRLVETLNVVNKTTE